MPDYSKGKIYKITGGGLTYIGSTIQTLAQRLAKHNSNKKSYDLGVSKLYTSSFKVLEYTDAIITLIEDVICERREQLLAKERKWIEEVECVNKNVPLRTNKEYCEDNVERVKGSRKLYYDENKIYILEGKKENYLKNQDDRTLQTRNYYQMNKEKIKRKKREKYFEKKQSTHI